MATKRGGGMAASTQVVTTGLDLIVKQLDGGPSRVWLCSPFIGREVGAMLAEDLGALVEANVTNDPRVLTSLTEANLRSGYTDPHAVRRLLAACEGRLRTLTNVHAKICIVGGWALIGSGTLSAAGLAGLNAELGVATRDARIVDEAASHFEYWWRKAARVRATQLKGWKASRPRPAAGSRAGTRGTLPTRRVAVEGGSVALARWQRDRAMRSLARVLDADARLQPNSRPRLPRKRSTAYRDCQKLRDNTPGTRKTLAAVLRGHPMADARVHAAWQLSQPTLPPAGIEAVALRALRDAYTSDPALPVRRNARRALLRLRQMGAITIDGPLHDPVALKDSPPRPKVRKVATWKPQAQP